MIRSEALTNIRSTNTETRLAAARFFTVEAQVEDLPLLRTLEQSETVPWILRALKIACERLEQPTHNPVENDEYVDSTIQDAGAYSKILRDVSSRILHEIGPLIGGLLASAPTEVTNYNASRTRLLIEQLSNRTEALRNMRTATATPKFEEFDLSALVSEMIEAEEGAKEVEIIITGPEKFFVSADRSQLSMALSNGLRNAIEAVNSVSDHNPQLIISWDSTQHENWLFLKDNGPGLKHPVVELLKDGITDKDGHSGYGLSLAREAMISMQGEISLKSDEDGAHFELRWYRKNEDFVS